MPSSNFSLSDSDSFYIYESDVDSYSYSSDEERTKLSSDAIKSPQTPFETPIETLNQVETLEQTSVETEISVENLKQVEILKQVETLNQNEIQTSVEKQIWIEEIPEDLNDDEISLKDFISEENTTTIKSDEEKMEYPDLNEVRRSLAQIEDCEERRASRRSTVRSRVIVELPRLTISMNEDLAIARTKSFRPSSSTLCCRNRKKVRSVPKRDSLENENLNSFFNRKWYAVIGKFMKKN